MYKNVKMGQVFLKTENSETSWSSELRSCIVLQHKQKEVFVNIFHKMQSFTKQAWIHIQ